MQVLSCFRQIPNPRIEKTLRNMAQNCNVSFLYLANGARFSLLFWFQPFSLKIQFTHFFDQTSPGIPGTSQTLFLHDYKEHNVLVYCKSKKIKYNQQHFSPFLFFCCGEAECNALRFFSLYM